MNDGAWVVRLYCTVSLPTRACQPAPRLPPAGPPRASWRPGTRPYDASANAPCRRAARTPPAPPYRGGSLRRACPASSVDRPGGRSSSACSGRGRPASPSAPAAPPRAAASPPPAYPSSSAGSPCCRSAQTPSAPAGVLTNNELRRTE
eukprot:scaffold28215_cov42-Phaeocystis_antarctica.AAC.2